MTTPPADSPAPERPLPWWRHRRRLFYLAVVGATVAALWGGWVWWYRADFPVPSSAQCQVFGISEALYGKWYFGSYVKLKRWKITRETLRLHLPGTVWQNRHTGVYLTFGADGQLVWERPLDWEDRVLVVDPFASSGQRETERAALTALQRASYQFHPSVPVEIREGASPNLSVPDSPWDGYLTAYSNREIHLIFRSKPESRQLPNLHLHLTRVPAAP